ncbi:tRNA threonylcarbamoyladenosine biosynthesis protein TsaB [Caldimonas brevitalea]|uniref:tRNA threonylcarbamoyladenosine biosynthesis protein TsaB n=2 Tax=Caldimonas brevitalea TaxID=413882 RepID=A0A0G3BDX0_9BURK|nr:tRNA threonylcarbamoyladenosine biosynthesis protein TsaB [Caldimonas brevitalea]
MYLGVAVGTRVLSRVDHGGAQASARLLPALLALLEEAGVGLQQVDAIAFGRGPGAFTGLRTACSVTQGLAFGAGKPVLPIDTLLVVAEAARQHHGCTDVWATLDARMNEIYAAHYRHDGSRWHTQRPPALYSAPALAEQLAREGTPAVAGNAAEVHRASLATGPWQLLPDAVPDAGALLALAQAAWARGEAVDAAEALPLYIRDKVAQTTAEREAQKSAQGEVAQ